MTARDTDPPDVVDVTAELSAVERAATRRARGDRAGTTLGRYRLESLLGAGGMGEVYRALDVELERHVALKLVIGDSPDDGARLVREARALARLNHPNIVTVHDAGTTDGGVFVAMELVAGQTLGAWARERPRPWREVVRALAAAGDGLAAAHAAGLVHRDVKPDNILVGDDGRVRVADFGLARAVGDAAPEPREPPARSPQPQLTATGRLVGTPAYMAPERHAGGPATARSDQYEWATSVYEALYGMRPFAGPDATTLPELEHAKRAGTLGFPPSKVPRGVQRVLARALGADPAARHESMARAVAALRDAARPSRRWSLAAAGGVAAAVTAAALALPSRSDEARCDARAGAIAAVWDDAAGATLRARLDGRGLPPDTGARVVAALDGYAAAWRAARGEVCRALERRDVSAELHDRTVACLEQRRVELDARRDGIAAGGVRGGAWELEAALELSPIADCAGRARGRVPLPADVARRAALASLEAALARVRALHAAGDYRGAWVAAAALRGPAAATGYGPATAEQRFLEARARLQLQDPEGIPVGRDAARLAAEAGDDALAADAWIMVFRHLVIERWERQRLAELEDTIHAVEAVVARAGDPRRAVELQIERAVYLASREDFRGAVALLDATVATARARLGADDPLIATAQMWRARLNGTFGQFAEARAAATEALELRRRRYGAHPLTAEALMTLARVLRGAGEARASLPYDEEALAIREKVFGPESPEVAALLSNQSAARRELGDFAEARALAARAVAIIEKQKGADHPDAALIRQRVALVHIRAGESAAALAILEPDLAIIERNLGADSHHAGFVWGAIAEAHLLAGDFRRALAAAQAELAILEKKFGAAADLTRDAALDVGWALVGMGRARDALPYLERAVACAECEKDVRALARAALARALASSGGDRARAARLAGDARAASPSLFPAYRAAVERTLDGL